MLGFSSLGMGSVPIIEAHLFCPEEKAHIPTPDEPPSLPVRLMANATTVDENNDDSPICPSTLEDPDYAATSCVAIGLVVPSISDPEGEGVDEQSDCEGEAVDEQPRCDTRPQLVRSSAIIQFWIDYEDPDGDLWFRTLLAWYIVRQPSGLLHSFWRKRKLAQCIVTAAQADPPKLYSAFLGSSLHSLASEVSSTPAELQHELGDALEVLFSEGVHPSMLHIPLIAHLVLQFRGTLKANPNGKIGFRRRKRQRDIDSFVISRQQLHLTRVTPRVFALAEPYFPKRLVQLGRPLDEPMLGVRGADERDQLWHCLARLHRMSPFATEYREGDVVLTCRKDIHSNQYPTSRKTIPTDARLHDYFRFELVSSVNTAARIVHTQILVHSSDTMIAEIHHPSELYYSKRCKDTKYDRILGMATVTFLEIGELSSNQVGYFCRLVYDHNAAAYTAPPGTGAAACTLCSAAAPASDVAATENFVLNQKTYCRFDFVLMATHTEHTDNAPSTNNGEVTLCKIGQILRIDRYRQHSAPKLLIRPLGRVDTIRPQGVKRNERHLFITDETIIVNTSDVLRKCHVLLPDDTSKDVAKQPDVFVLLYRFESWPSRAQQAWPPGSHCRASTRDVQHCQESIQNWIGHERDFTATFEQLRTLDIFGGVGAFSGGMVDTRVLRVTHAIEIAPSAARHSNTIVYNQCANVILDYVISKNQGKQPKTATDVLDNPLPPPPRQGDIDVIVAGCPCQPHSGLNQFARHDDRKTELFLNLLSFVEYYCPRFLYFENVPGFATTRLLTGDGEDDPGIRGGILKLFLCSLHTLGYQCRFQVLQAASFGAPQGRKRFFLIASRGTTPLPAFPPAQYAFPRQDSISIEDGYGQKVPLSSVATGVASHHYRTIEDAIGDLWPFDCVPEGQSLPQLPWPSVLCIADEMQHYGPPITPTQYYHEPMNNFQAECRERPCDDLQHYTMAYPLNAVERAALIGLQPGADFTSLPPQQWSHGMAHPESATAAHGFRPGSHYGRLGKDDVFRTIVTNIGPDAKQALVLHPYCRRLYTVRELARAQGFPDWFKFETIHDEDSGVYVKLIHRQIGNAVAWPVSRELGWELRKVLFEEWKLGRRARPTIIH